MDKDKVTSCRHSLGFTTTLGMRRQSGELNPVGVIEQTNPPIKTGFGALKHGRHVDPGLFFLRTHSGIGFPVHAGALWWTKQGLAASYSGARCAMLIHGSRGRPLSSC